MGYLRVWDWELRLSGLVAFVFSGLFGQKCQRECARVLDRVLGPYPIKGLAEASVEVSTTVFSLSRSIVNRATASCRKGGPVYFLKGQSQC